MKSKRFSCLISVLLAGAMVANSGVLAGAMEREEELFEVNATSLAPEEKISPDLYEHMESDEETIPVIIWYKDINQDEVNEQVEKKVGYSLEDLEVAYTPPSDELLATLSNAAEKLDSLSDSIMAKEQKSIADVQLTQENLVLADEYLQMLMDTHMEVTASARELERVRTNEYLETKEEVCKEQYAISSSTLVESLKLDDNSQMFFASSYAPMIVCELTPEEIEVVSENQSVEEISYFEPIEAVDCAWLQVDKDKTVSSMGFDDIHNTLGLTGNGVSIGIYERNSVSSDYAADNNVDMSKVESVGDYHCEGDHATYVASVMIGTYGIAPESKLYSTSVYSDQNSYNQSTAKLSQLEKLVGAGVKVINESLSVAGHNDTNATSYDYWEKYTDYLIANTGVTIVCATANFEDKHITSPALSYNCIAVNGCTDDKLNLYSYMHGKGCFKPDVIAECRNFGTSTAAPVITGMIALLYQYKPSLMAYPQVVKAILMASSHKKMSQLTNETVLSNESLSAGLTDRQGAGLPNMYRMISMVAQHSYGSGVLEPTGLNMDLIHFVQPKYGASNMNVCMAYLQTTASVSNPSATVENLDIYLSNGNASSEKNSKKANSSTEMVYMKMSDTSDKYNLKIKSENILVSRVTYGYAWSTDKMKFYPTKGEEGIYHLKNHYSGAYLSMNNDSLETTQEIFDATKLNQNWIFSYSPSNGKYTLKNAGGTEKGLTIGTAINSSYVKAVGTMSTLNSNITVQPHDDGTISLLRSVSGVTYALDINGSSRVAGAVAAWSKYTKSSVKDSQKWNLQAVCYMRGDVNMNGKIDDTDRSTVLQIAAEIGANGTTTYNNVSVFLGDYDDNGKVNSSDAALIAANKT